MNQRIFYLVATALIIFLLASCSTSVEEVSKPQPDVFAPNTNADPVGSTYGGPILIKLKCSDTESGCDPNAIYYSTDETQSVDAFSVYNEKNPIAISASTTLRFYSKDYKGNEEAVKTEKYIIDYPPTLIDPILNFTISDNIIEIIWQAAIDEFSDKTQLNYQLYYADVKDINTVQEIESNGVPYFTNWQKNTSASIDTQVVVDAKVKYWNVVVKDSFDNKVVYSASQFPGNAPISTVNITSELSANLKSIVNSPNGTVTACIIVDSGVCLPMSINNQQASISLSNVSAINHEIIIIFSYSPSWDASLSLMLAKIGKSLDLSTTQSSVIITEADLVSIGPEFDADGDTVSNLDELLVSGNPFDPGPTFTSSSNISVAEGSNQVVSVQAFSPIGNAVNYLITSGADLFSIDSFNGLLVFNIPPVYVLGGINQYSVTIQASDSKYTSSQNIIVTVTDVFDLNVNIGFKHLNFIWNALPNADYYKILENPDGISGFSEVMGGGNILGESFSQEIAVHLFDQTNAQYILQAYNNSGKIKESDPLSITGNLSNAVGTIQPNGLIMGDRFGASSVLSADGNTLVVGAPSADIGIQPNAGAVYVFNRDINGAWSTQSEKLYADDYSKDNYFGHSVAISADGNTLVVGAYGTDIGVNIDVGSVYVFTRNNNKDPWPQIPNQKLIPETTDRYFGYSTAISADSSILLIGSPHASFSTLGNIGVVQIYAKGSNGLYYKVQTLQSNDSHDGDAFGYAISIGSNGNSLAVGAPNADLDFGLPSVINNTGAVYLFKKVNNQTLWQYLPDLKLQSSILQQDDNYGSKICLSSDENTLVVGASNTDITQSSGVVTDAGAVYVLNRGMDGMWSTQGQKLYANDPEFVGNFGASVSINAFGNILVVGSLSTIHVPGAPFPSAHAGAVYTFVRGSSTDAWPNLPTKKIQAINPSQYDYFGFSVNISLDGNELVVGAPSASAYSAGNVFLF